MSEILKEWLSERLQQSIKWNADDFGATMKNGHMIARLLLSYHVVNEQKFSLVQNSTDTEDITSNWNYLSKWLQELNIFLTDNELSEIKDGKGSILLRLFYQLFLHLDKQDRTNFIKRERKIGSALIEKIEKRFKVEKVDEDEEPTVDYLCKPLLDHKQFIEWQKKKAAQVKETYDFVKHRYLKTCARIEEAGTRSTYKAPPKEKLPAKEKIEMDQFDLKHPVDLQNCSYGQLVNLEETIEERQQNTFLDEQWAKNYIENLQTKLKKKSDSEEFQKQMTNVLSGSLWDVSMAGEENKLDTDLAKKVMKLSHFEKQMCTQIMETKQQARNLIKTRIDAEMEFSEQREQQFSLFLDNIKEQIYLEVEEIDFEKHRQKVLHKKLYEEKTKRKKQHYYEICYETMLSIVDYATKYAYFKLLLEDDIPDRFIHDWKALYYKKQPIFDILDPLENILKEQGLEEEINLEEETVIHLELDRQQILNENDFKEYINFSGPWDLDALMHNHDTDAEERYLEYLGSRILGHVVYTLLEIKYPYPDPRKPADLPNFPSKALLRGLPDRSITVPMQTLLDLHKIHVTRLETAINYCLKMFKLEMIGCTDIDISFDKFLSVAHEENKDIIYLLKTDEEKKESEFTSTAIPANAKQTQTPKTLPEEDMVLSTAAELGKYSYECLASGDSLTDHLLAAILLEYIKEQRDINGFVIVNYPNSYREAQILEETFSGKEPPDEEELDDRDDIYLEESIQKHRKKLKDPNASVRVSKLVDDPHCKGSEKPFVSYFTSYINLKKTLDILQEDVIWDLTEANSEMIDRFYACLGLNYSMYYEVIDKNFLIQICTCIIGDFSLPLKSAEDLFGDILNSLDFPSSEDKRQKSKILKPELMSAINLKTDASGPQDVDDLDSINVDISVSEQNRQGYGSKASNIEDTKILPGDEKWEYADLPTSQPVGMALASVWEEAEKAYVHDIEQLFFAVRLQMHCLVPYARFIKDKMEQVITLPSHKQDLVVKFLTEYNRFENDWRDVNMTKNEWHCRVKELQSQLYHICDERKIYAEQQRKALICDNWTMEELTSMANTYISCMQAELNRSVLTFQTIQDFYFMMLNRLPPTDKPCCKELSKISRESEEGAKGPEDKLYKQLKNTFLDMHSKNICIDYSNNPFNIIIENNIKIALPFIKSINDSCRSLINKENAEITKIVPSKIKDDNLSKDKLDLEETTKKNYMKCIEEWNIAIQGEMLTTFLRLSALQYKCNRDMKLFNDHIMKTFMDIQNDIDEYYTNEVESVDRLCKYIQLAIEDGRRIKESLILEYDKFVIDPNLLQFATLEKVTDNGEVKESISITEFRISQLARLRSQFRIVAPTGMVLQQAFIYLLQDFILYGNESCDGPLVPQLWKCIDAEQVPKLVYALFGETVYIDWREFLILCLNIRFPDVTELLELRKKYRCVDKKTVELIDRDSYMNEVLWFEHEFNQYSFQAQLRLTLIKHFLFELYETSENTMNYSAFLLSFCKNINPIAGFASAVSMAIGKKTCFDLNECIEFVQALIKLKKYKEELRARAHKFAEEFLATLMDQVINECEGVIITEVINVEPNRISKKMKGKESAAVVKGKKIESAHSVRTLRAQDTFASNKKLVLSAIDIKSTYLCEPCEVDKESEKADSPVSIEENNESPNDNISPKVDLAYSISQIVLWNVLKTCLPWHFEWTPENKPTPYVEQVTEVMKRLENDTENGDIYLCKFVADPVVCKLLHKVKKFNVINLIEEVEKFA